MGSKSKLTTRFKLTEVKADRCHVAVEFASWMGYKWVTNGTLLLAPSQWTTLKIKLQNLDGIRIIGNLHPQEPDEASIVNGFDRLHIEAPEFSANQAVTPEDWNKWKNNPQRPWYCAFCGKHGKFNDFLNTLESSPGAVRAIFGCGSCRDYKGMEPCIPDKCHWGGE